MSLKEKLLAIADDDGVSFDKNLVQCTFLKSVRTGLKDEGVSHVLLPYLKDTNITMVGLLKQCKLITAAFLLQSLILPYAKSCFLTCKKKVIHPFISEIFLALFENN